MAEVPSESFINEKLIEALKKNGPAPSAPTPLTDLDELEGSEKVEGFAVNLDE
jgi:hypothetical protein